MLECQLSCGVIGMILKEGLKTILAGIEKVRRARFVLLGFFRREPAIKNELGFPICFHL